LSKSWKYLIDNVALYILSFRKKAVNEKSSPKWENKGKRVLEGSAKRRYSVGCEMVLEAAINGQASAIVAISILRPAELLKKVKL
jgi:hypothetical protein